LTILAPVVLALLLQAGRQDSVQVTGEPSVVGALGGRTLHVAHVVSGARTGDSITPGVAYGTIEPLPNPLSKRHQRAIDSARVLYSRQEYLAAAAVLAPAYADERDNPFVANEYARTLFRIDGRRDSAFAVYQRLIQQLDRKLGTNDKQVAIDAWFSEAYWKLASLYLDRRQWDSAVFEIVRFLTTSGDPRNPALEQVYTYLAEALVHVGRADAARWSAEQALRLNPHNTEALGYLYQLGEAARAWPATHVFACRNGTDSIPCRGGYTFYRGTLGLICVAPREETPPTPAVASICQHVGWLHVGLPRRSVEEILGAPWQRGPDRGDGTESIGYLVFLDSLRNRGSYYIVEYERVDTQQIARSVQFTGDSTPLPIDFSGLRLGDATQRILSQLGPPETRGEFNDEAQGIKGEWWDWNRSGISFEIVAGRLFSIRVWRTPETRPAPVHRDFMRFR
jgi:hypothetical protein